VEPKILRSKIAGILLLFLTNRSQIVYDTQRKLSFNFKETAHPKENDHSSRRTVLVNNQKKKWSVYSIMTTVLYITAHPFTSDTYSLSVGEQFIETYKETHPNDEVIHLDLYRMDIPQIDADLLRRWGQPPAGPSFEELSEESKAKAIRMNEIVEQFMTADKVVIVNPVWNYAFPPVLKNLL
jgi:hypothetical protein